MGTLEKNFERLVALKNAKFVISAQMATNLLSVTSLPELLKYFWSLFEKYGVVVQLHQNIITDPPAHSPTLLTREFSKYFDESISFLTEKAPYVDDTIDTDCRKWKKYADFLETIKYSMINHVLTHHEKNMIGQFFNKFNTRQRIDIYKIFPEYQSFFNACGIYRMFEIKLFNNYPKIFKRYMKTKVSAWHVKRKLQTIRTAINTRLENQHGL